MKDFNRDRVEELLRQAVPPVDNGAEPQRDLWPAMLRRMNTEPAAHNRWAWFDGALLAGIAAMAIAFPASIPVLLYYL